MITSHAVEVSGTRFLVDPEPRWTEYWSGVTAGTWEPGTFTVLRALLKPGHRFVDCGTWIGPTALFAASLGADVDAYECDPVALRSLEANLELNPELKRRTTVNKYALGLTDGLVQLHSNGLGGSESSLVPLQVGTDQEGIISESVVVKQRDARTVFLHHDYLTDENALIKMDIEGFEYQMIDHLADLIDQSSCSFYVSFHPGRIHAQDGHSQRVARVLKTLRWMDVFWKHLWFGGSAEGLHAVDKEEAVENASRDLKSKRIIELLLTRKHPG